MPQAARSLPKSSYSFAKVVTVIGVVRYWMAKEAFCFGFTLLAGITGHELLEHNAAIELIFSGLLGCAIEYVGHRWLHRHAAEAHVPARKRYAIAVVVSLMTWPVHAALFHHHHDHAPVVAGAEQAAQRSPHDHPAIFPVKVR